ncbi:MAG: methyltransferase domain-containing protein [Solirubrobacterales bacterium]
MPELTLRTAMQLYETGLQSGAAGGAPPRCHAVGEDGSRRRLPLERWLRNAAAEEELLLSELHGPVLDVGCGAGRHLVALRELGVAATGVEISPAAAAIARGRGAEVIEGSIFELALTGSWAAALLLDGNIGIGGDPGGLLGRVAALLRPGGLMLVELEPPAAQTRRLRLRLETATEVSDWIPWAWVGADAIESLAGAAGLRAEALRQIGGRWFAWLRLEPELCRA